MNVTEDSFFAVLTTSGVSMPAVPAGVVRSIRSISFTNNDTAEDGQAVHLAHAKVTRSGATYSIVEPMEVKQRDGARAGHVGSGILKAGDVLRLYASTSSRITAWVSFHDREVPAE
ncbi:hypothetical protein RR11_2019 [Ruegeria sp. R11]|uniref:Uncharacterized protein n=1 Tax=Phaeobacter italicus TaxID=481446 RepID=A0A0H5CY91_9RHOB|nr:hypothetical protein [Phaeobacter italicus]EEB71259.1 hypothetical protein RR11_2019 [Ruegeria sp. R11]CRL09754.1 hypothetical protein NIT7321_00588 [Phaeobacter italicus]